MNRISVVVFHIQKLRDTSLFFQFYHMLMNLAEF